MKNLHVLSILIVLLWWGSTFCNRSNTTVTLEGKVTEFSGGGALEGVEITVAEKKLENGAIPINYTLLGVTTTDAQGRYEFSFEKNKTIEIKVAAQLNGFYEEFVVRDLDNLSSIEPNIEDFILRAQADLKLNILNNGDTDIGDEITVVVENDASICLTCCDAINLNGAVDTVIYCNVTGNRNLSYSYLVSNETGINFSEETVFCPPEDTTQIFITY